jgi:hypothetical protein
VGAGRRTLLLLLAVTGALLALPPGALAYDWPLKPFDEQHAIRGYFNDPRREDLDGVLETSFHFGIDISAPDGTAVYAVEGGVASVHASSVSVSAPAGRNFGYWHVSPVVDDDAVVERHQLIGYVQPGWGHLHFAESLDGIYLNPLRPGALEPYVDTTSPTIASISIVAAGRPVDLTRVRGSVDLLCDAFDMPPLAPPGPWRDSRVTPVLIRWRIVRGDTQVVRWQTAVDFRYYLVPDALFNLVYAPGTRQNRANRPGHYSFYLAHDLQTRRLPNGSYGLQVAVGDSRGNSAFGNLPFTVANGP